LGGVVEGLRSSQDPETRDVFRTHIDSCSKIWCSLAYLAISSQPIMEKTEDSVSNALRDLPSLPLMDGLAQSVDTLICSFTGLMRAGVAPVLRNHL
jgi:hypothetical protein